MILLNMILNIMVILVVIKNREDTIDIMFDTGAAITTVRKLDITMFLGANVDLCRYADIPISGYTDELYQSANSERKIMSGKTGKLIALQNVSIGSICLRQLFVVVVDNKMKGNLLGCDFISIVLLKL